MKTVHAGRSIQPTAPGPFAAPATSERTTVLERGDLAAARVTVAITLYDYEGYIVETLESIYDQTLAETAIVVIDDASSDQGPERVRRWMERTHHRFAGVLLARHVRNAGLAHARNGAFDAARSELIMVLDADNHLHPRCLERLADSLGDCTNDGDPGFAYSIIERFGRHRGLMGTDTFNRELLSKGNYIDAMAMVRKSVWQRVGGYTRMDVGGWEDYDFWCKCVEAGIDGLFVPEILCRYRHHGESMLARETDAGRNARRVRREMAQRHPWLELGWVDDAPVV